MLEDLVHPLRLKKLTETVCCTRCQSFSNLTLLHAIYYSASHIEPVGKWKRVRIPHGPAAVTGDESRALSLVATSEWEER
jgi:hypothetical protein